MAEKKNILTEQGLKKLEDELQELTLVRRKENAKKIKEAREQGDLSENAEYDAAKEEQKEIAARIEEIENILKNVEVVYSTDIDKDRVNIGTSVTVRYPDGKVVIFKIVGSTEVATEEDVFKNKISNESPIGSALIGKKKGSKVTVDVPAGAYKLEILDINVED